MPRIKSPASLPQKSVTWHASIHTLKTWITPEDQMAYRPSFLLVTISEDHQVLGSETFQSLPKSEQVLEALVEVMKKPEQSTHLRAHRPQEIIFDEEHLATALRPALEKWGIISASEPVSEDILGIFASLEDFLDEQSRTDEEEVQPPAILDVPGNTPELVGRVWAAAADYYQAAPWRSLSDGQPLALQFSPAEKQGFVQLMGNGGMQYGLVFHWQWDDVLKFYVRMEQEPLETIPVDGIQAFTYEEADYLPDADLDAIQEYGWKIAGPKAYPMPIIYLLDGLERPGAEMLVFYEAALRAIPEFVKHLIPDEADDYLELEIPVAVETACGPMTVRIHYPAGELPASIFLEDDEIWDEDVQGEPDEELKDFYLEGALDEGDEAGIPLDQRAYEGVLSALSHELDAISGQKGILSPELIKAQQIIQRAWKESLPARRIALAHKALETSPDCADAYVLLAEEDADTPEEALEQYEKGMQAGERILGNDYFERYKGMFWGLIETRGYMRARAGVAECLEYMNRSDESIMHYQALLELNPNDNQGIRYELLGLLIRENKNDAAGKLLERYTEDGSAIWAYSRALLAFRRLGPSIQADAALRRALRINPHVPPYLSGYKTLPEEFPENIGVGDENEALDYALQHFGNWWNTRGAIPWMKEMAKNTRSARGNKALKRPRH